MLCPKRDETCATKRSTACLLMRPITPDGRELLNMLCRRIAVEKDSGAFDELVRRLNDLFEEDHDRLTTEQHQKPS